MSSSSSSSLLLLLDRWTDVPVSWYRQSLCCSFFRTLDPFPPPPSLVKSPCSYWRSNPGGVSVACGRRSCSVNMWLSKSSKYRSVLCYWLLTLWFLVSVCMQNTLNCMCHCHQTTSRSRFDLQLVSDIVRWWRPLHLNPNSLTSSWHHQSFVIRSHLSWGEIMFDKQLIVSDHDASVSRWRLFVLNKMRELVWPESRPLSICVLNCIKD